MHAANEEFQYISLDY